MTTTLKLKGLLLVLGASAFAGCNNNTPAPPKPGTAVTRLPQNVKASCTVSAADFNGWFEGGKAMENGLVKPANSVTFPHTNNCSFYLWSEQMFLWMMSPTTPGKYEPGNTVLESPMFYDVSSADSDGHRTLKQHKKGEPITVLSHIAQTGPHRLPVVIDKQGRMFEVEPVSKNKATGRAMLQSAANAAVEVDHVTADAAGHHTFFAKDGKPIAEPKAMIQHTEDRDAFVQEFNDGNGPVYLTAKGGEIEVGQATGDVLMAQNYSLVYYILAVNDVYAYYLTAAKKGKMSREQFPTTAAERDSICAIARACGDSLPDSNALAIELKTSWVETKDLANLSTYVVIEAMVPEYNTADPKRWVPKGTFRKAKLALVGMHIVGSLAGHPEMSWATFEHQDNTPFAEYQYLDSAGNMKLNKADTGKGWLFSSNAADPDPNKSHMKASGDTIAAAHIGTTTATYAMDPSNTLQVYPWGSAKDSLTNPEDKSSAASNSELLSINNNIRNLLQGNDVRKNYLMIGASWTHMGTAPNGKVYSKVTDTAGYAIGTSLLSNTTMETYFQRPGKTCFTCHHRATNGLRPDSLSHVFSEINGLALKPKSMGK